MTDQKLEYYKDIVCALSYELAMMSLAAENARKGHLTDSSIVEKGLKNAERMREAYLEARKGIGLSEKGAFVAFKEDQFFQDFKLRGGILEGDQTCVEGVAGKWNIKKLPTEDEAIRYEVGVYCLMYAGAAQSVFVALKEDEATTEGWAVTDASKKEGGIRKLGTGIISFVSARLKIRKKPA